MAIAVATTKQSVSNAYAALGNWAGLTTGSPGSSASPANEASGGGYARQQFTWTAATGGVNNGSSVPINVPAGTFTHVILCSSSSGASMLDWANPADLVMSQAGQIVVTPKYTQS